MKKRARIVRASKARGAVAAGELIEVLALIGGVSVACATILITVGTYYQAQFQEDRANLASPFP